MGPCFDDVAKFYSLHFQCVPLTLQRDETHHKLDFVYILGKSDICKP